MGNPSSIVDEAWALFGDNIHRLNLLVEPLSADDKCAHEACEQKASRLILIRMFEKCPVVYQFKSFDVHAERAHGTSVGGPGNFPWRP
jgi:hypothetical protein